jgi:hypothetical protein
MDPLNHSILIGISFESLSVLHLEVLRSQLDQQSGCRIVQKFLQEKPLFAAAATAEAVMPNIVSHVMSIWHPSEW